ncbi:hypothetical protein JHK82_053031 [Glycine max]|nr:hypothetical protein JHK86_052876 [Glycine max]KAG4927249.1 hypothetical protein JHK85_053735 [Glycine max]KAG5082867.1 hypothetical protein JHK84_052905 [Glycine max]KAG5085634.1 hypothetical protein JHK82_053031 [Glycine max]
MIDVDLAQECYPSTIGGRKCEGDQAMTRTASFEIKDLFYVNNKLGDEKDKSKFFKLEASGMKFFLNWPKYRQKIL